MNIFKHRTGWRGFCKDQESSPYRIPRRRCGWPLCSACRPPISRTGYGTIPSRLWSQIWRDEQGNNDDQKNECTDSSLTSESSLNHRNSDCICPHQLRISRDHYDRGCRSAKMELSLETVSTRKSTAEKYNFITRFKTWVAICQYVIHGVSSIVLYFVYSIGVSKQRSNLIIDWKWNNGKIIFDGKIHGSYS